MNRECLHEVSDEASELSPDFPHMSPKLKEAVSSYLQMRRDLRLLAQAEESGGDLQAGQLADLQRKLTGELLRMSDGEFIVIRLDFTELELARLRKFERMTREMREKFGRYVDDFLYRALGV